MLRGMADWLRNDSLLSSHKLTRLPACAADTAADDQGTEALAARRHAGVVAAAL